MQWCVKTRARRDDASINHDPELQCSVTDDAPGANNIINKTKNKNGIWEKKKAKRKHIRFVLVFGYSIVACMRSVRVPRL